LIYTHSVCALHLIFNVTASRIVAQFLVVVVPIVVVIVVVGFILKFPRQKGCDELPIQFESVLLQSVYRTYGITWPKCVN